jgi:chromosome segregation ATPase
MSQFSKTVDDVKVLAKKFKAIIELGEALEKISSVENAAKEAEGLRAHAQVELEKAKSAVEAKKKDLESVEASVLFAQAKADKVIEAAHIKAKSIVDDAIAESQEFFKDIEKNKKLFDNQFIDAGKELASVKADIELKKQELESLKKEVESVKQKFAALLK